MGTVKRYLPEVRERAIRLVVDHPSQWAGIESVAPTPAEKCFDPRGNTPGEQYFATPM